MSSADRWLRKISNLKPYNAKGGLAPHKPLLLLVVLEMVEKGELANRILTLTPHLHFDSSRFGRLLPIAELSGRTFDIHFII